MLPIVPYQLEEIKNDLKRKAIDEFGLLDAEFEGSNVSQLINLLAYSTVINNTNLTYGLNEMFISQATDRKNVIKHARQMGYTHKRNLSYQYKIKLKSIREGYLTLPKYSNFSSNGNNYVYLDEDISDNYGTNAFIKALVNEYNNSSNELYKNLLEGQIVITEDGVACKVLEKSKTGTDRFLLQSLEDGSYIPKLSEIQTQDVMVYDGVDAITGYRNFIKVGSVDTFLRDEATDMFKVQITLVKGMTFPIYTLDNYSTTVLSDHTLAIDSPNPIKNMDSITLTSGADVIDVDVSTLTYIGDRNVQFPPLGINAAELLTLGSGTADENYNYTFTPSDIMIMDSFGTFDINYGNNRIQKIEAADVVVDYTNNLVIVPQQSTPKFNTFDVVGSTITTNELVKSVSLIVILDTDTGNRFSVPNFSFTESGVITLLDENNIELTIYDAANFVAEVDYSKIELLTDYLITLNYTYNKVLTGYAAVVDYSYDMGNDGYLDKKFYFSDFRGESSLNEKDEDPIHGWNGFYASSFDSETNVLYFDVTHNLDPETGITTYENPYVPILQDDGTYTDAKPLDQVMTSPFKKTRFFYATLKPDDLSIGYINEGNDYIPDGNTCFASINSVTRKDTIEIIVKEGNMKRYQELDEDGAMLYPELRVPINEAMVDAGYFTVYAPSMENNGMELFVTRIMPDGSVENEYPWVLRDYLLAEHTDTNQTAEPMIEDYDSVEQYDIAMLLFYRHRTEETFMVMPDLEYEDYVNVYTKYSGTGVALKPDFLIHMNILDSKGADGKAKEIIEPVNSEDFVGINYIESSFTPHIMHVEGTNTETTDSIRDNAPLFSNTANRAVTKADYKTICEAQPFISSAQIWGGEELPRDFSNGSFSEKRYGHIYFSIIPYSKPYLFSEDKSTYTLNDAYETDLFFPSYSQITGKDTYTQIENQRKNDKNVLFSVLDNYKIITLQLDYVKAVYLDMNINIDVLKYKFGQTITETNEAIFKSCRTFMIKEIEQFDSTFYLSSLIKHIDESLGDGYGLNASIDFSIDLYDSYVSPESGTFFNLTKSALTPRPADSSADNYLSSEASIYPGFRDEWVFEVAIEMPLEDLFEANWVNESGLVEAGKMNIANLTHCNTSNFIEPDDFLYMEMDDGTFISHNADGILETSLASSSSERIEISVMYKKSPSSTINPGALYRVGTYTISRSEQLIILRLNTSGYMHMNNPDTFKENILYTDTDADPDALEVSIPNEFYKAPRAIGTTLIDGIATDYVVQEASFNRDDFMNIHRVLKINPKNSNIKVLKNTYPRLKKVEFTSK